MGPVACVPLLLFAGFFVKNDTIPWYLRWCSYGSFARYAFEGSLLAVYGPVGGRNRSEIVCELPDEDFFGMIRRKSIKLKLISGTNPNCPVNDPQLIMEYFSAKPKNLGWDCAMLIIFFLALRIIAFLSLKVKLSLHNDNLLTHTRYFYQQLKSEGIRAAFGCDTRKSSGCCC